MGGRSSSDACRLAYYQDEVILFYLNQYHHCDTMHLIVIIIIIIILLRLEYAFLDKSTDKLGRSSWTSNGGPVLATAVAMHAVLRQGVARGARTEVLEVAQAAVDYPRHLGTPERDALFVARVRGRSPMPKGVHGILCTQATREPSSRDLQRFYELP